MDKSRFSLNVLIAIGFLVIIIFATSVLTTYEKTNISNFPKITSKNPSLGEKGAEIQIIEFGDFQCPYCQSLSTLFRQLYFEYQGKVRLVWKDFPLTTIHDQSLKAALAARCAQEQGKFWEMHDKLFENQKNLGEELYLSLAKEIGLEENKFSNCLISDKTLDLIAEDLQEGVRLGVEGTPHFYINQYVITELIDYERLKSVVDLLLVE